MGIRRCGCRDRRPDHRRLGPLAIPEPAAAPRARVYRDIDVCLLTDAKGVAAGQARQTWQGLQDYSTATAVRVSYVPVIGPATTKNAAAFLAGLMQRRCQVVVAVGAAQVAAVEQASTRSPDTGFVVVGATRQDRANVVAVSPAEARLSGAVSSAVGRLAKSNP